MTARLILVALLVSTIVAALMAYSTSKRWTDHGGGPFCEYPLPRDVDGRLLHDDYPMCEFKLRSV